MEATFAKKDQATLHQLFGTKAGNPFTIFQEKTKTLREMMEKNPEQIFTKGKDQILEVRRKGGMDSGGGNVCWVHGRPYLLELTNDLSKLSEPGRRFDFQDPVVVNFKNRKFKLPIRYMFHFDDHMRGFIESKLKRFDRLSPGWSYMIDAILRAQPTIFVENKLNSYRVQADLKGYPLCNQSNVTASALTSVIGTKMIEISVWNQMDLTSQAALLVHEALRVIQIMLSQSTITQYFMTNEELQNLVAYMFSDKPAFDIYKMPFMQALLLGHGVYTKELLAEFCGPLSSVEGQLNISPDTQRTVKEFCSPISKSSFVTAGNIVMTIQMLEQDLRGVSQKDQQAVNKVNRLIRDTKATIDKMIKGTFYSSAEGAAIFVTGVTGVGIIATSIENAFDAIRDMNAQYAKGTLNPEAIPHVERAAAIVRMVLEDTALDLTYGNQKK